MVEGAAVYFLSHYSLFEPGKVIIPMFMVTPSRYFFTDLSLYRLSYGPQDKLERLWSSDEGMGTLKNCRFARLGDKLYFSWVLTPADGEEKRPLPVLEYDLGTNTGRMLDLNREEEVIFSALDYHHPDTVNRLELWGRAGLLPLSEWGLPSPLEFSSMDPQFLKRVIVNRMGDGEFRTAALRELDARGSSTILQEILADIRKMPKNADQSSVISWEVLIRMTRTLRAGRPDDLFSAAFDNDAAALARFLDAGADPDSADQRGRTLMMWAVLGGAPDTLELLFERGADPKKESDGGMFPWWYAAQSPLRAHFLKLSEKHAEG